MSADVPGPISVTTKPGFWDLYVASLLLIRYQRVFIIIHLVFPAFGVFLLITPFMGYQLGPTEILLAAFCFSFTPLVVALSVWAAGRQSKWATGPVTYVFDSEGMHTSGPTFTQTIRWSGIVRVRCLKRFLLVFIAPARAHCILLRDLSHEDLERLLWLAAERTNSR